VIKFGRRTTSDVRRGSGTVVGRVGGAETGPAIVSASRVVGPRVIGSCPPIMCSVIAMPCARAGEEVWRVGIVGRSHVRVTGGDGWSLEAPGLRVRPGDLGQSDRGSVIRHGRQISMGQWRRRWYRSRVDQAPSGMRDRVDHGVPFCRKFCSRGAEGSIESFNAV
jgi:hypothetical protein